MPAIVIDDLWKEYRFGQLGYGTLRHDLQSWWARKRGRSDPNSKLNSQSPEGAAGELGDRFWALRGISFAVEPGEVLGVIGRNGAGKSTLLKVMSRVTNPTRGEVRLRGRLASLLEVGTGFHPDLTGRENVFLNGAILGMSRSEVADKFDEIVGFAEVERFIDTPVKRYSSGMYVRLAFAVAAHLEPEILVVDEVLAVGDLGFQKKCLGKMKDASGSGRTIIFVSHNMGAVRNLCDRCVLLEGGRLAGTGTPDEVIEGYSAGLDPTTAILRLEAARGAGRAWFNDAFVWVDGKGRVDSVSVREGFRVVLEIECREPLKDVEAGVRFERREGQRVFISEVGQTRGSLDLPRGRTTLSVDVPGSFLAPDTYHLTVGVHRPNVEFLALHENLLSLRVVETGSEMWRYAGVDVGAVLVRFPWSIVRASDEERSAPDREAAP